MLVALSGGTVRATLGAAAQIHYECPCAIHGESAPHVFHNYPSPIETCCKLTGHSSIMTTWKQALHFALAVSIGEGRWDQRHPSLPCLRFLLQVLQSPLCGGRGARDIFRFLPGSAVGGGPHGMTNRTLAVQPGVFVVVGCCCWWWWKPLVHGDK